MNISTSIKSQDILAFTKELKSNHNQTVHTFIIYIEDRNRNKLIKELQYIVQLIKIVSDIESEIKEVRYCYPIAVDILNVLLKILSTKYEKYLQNMINMFVFMKPLKFKQYIIANTIESAKIIASNKNYHTLDNKRFSAILFEIFHDTPDHKQMPFKYQARYETYCQWGGLDKLAKKFNSAIESHDFEKIACLIYYFIDIISMKELEKYILNKYKTINKEQLTAMLKKEKETKIPICPFLLNTDRRIINKIIIHSS